VGRNGSRTARLARAALALLAGGCALAARNHACYPYLAHRHGGDVPAELARALAREGDTQRRVERYRAPVGYYWRPRRGGSLDLGTVRTVVGDYELAPCPGGVAPLAGDGGGHPPPH
jgi:hypothetical protein